MNLIQRLTYVESYRESVQCLNWLYKLIRFLCYLSLSSDGVESETANGDIISISRSNRFVIRRGGVG